MRGTIYATLERLGRHVDLQPGTIDRLMDDLPSYGRKLVVDDDASFAAVSALEELGSTPFPAGSYGPGSQVGRSGVERQYEGSLQGRDGVRFTEVDARGRIVGGFSVAPTVAPRPGRDLTLNLDIELQQWIHHIFPDSLAGAVVALDPVDGGVLALFSAPTYDPNEFIGGVSPERWEDWIADSRRPLFDRATLGLYPPASTWKLAIAAIALELGVVAPDDRSHGNRPSE